VRVVEACRDLGLAQEAAAEALVAGELGAEQLQRDAVSARVLGEVDGAHRALTDERLDAKARDDGAGEVACGRVAIVARKASAFNPRCQALKY
jgi:hypothetical protein